MTSCGLLLPMRSRCDFAIVLSGGNGVCMDSQNRLYDMLIEQ